MSDVNVRDVMAVLPRRFLAKCRITPSGCWSWTGAVAGGGYAYFYLDGRMRRAHRVAWEAAVGPIPEGMDLDHLCRVRRCVNPLHLEPVTRSENNRRGLSTRCTDTCRSGHPADWYVDPRGRRECRVCKRLRRAKAAGIPVYVISHG